ncbi:MAG TPA: acyl-CoA dehydrogenase family protein, partial [Acidimicrobiales bacterium]|nr:acyl-CoA dehydrogenase family protein [Acidimicrobiales bacterium]
MPSAFELGPEAEELMAAAERLGRTELAPAVRDHERDARWPPRVLDVLRDISLGGLDLPERLGGAGAGCVVKVAVLETLAACDPGGLPAADQPGPAAGAFVACPDEEVAVEIAAACLAGSAQVALAVAAEPAEAPARIEWVPAWPPLTRVWLAVGDKLRLVAVDASSDSDEPALAFQASGTGSVDLGSGRELGAWSLPSG